MSLLNQFWNWALASFSPFQLGVFGTFLIYMAVFWGAGFFFYSLDYYYYAICYKHPERSTNFLGSLLFKHKIQPDLFFHNSWPSVKDCALDVLKQQFLIVLPLNCVLSPFLQWCGVYFSPEFPSILEVLGSLAFFATITEFTFYYSHRLLHHPSLYKWTHKKHHEYKAPFAFAGIYHQWINQIVDTLTFQMGPALLRSHIVTYWIWVAISVPGVLSHHSGYDFPGDIGQPSLFHEFHHYSFNSNFGVWGWLDWFHGTDAGYKEFVKQMNTTKLARQKQLDLAANKMAKEREGRD